MSDRCTLLQQINEISFVVNDLNLYLDTHPTDTSALEEFSQAMAQRRQLLDAFAKEYEPLTLNCVCPDTNNKSESHTKYPGQKHFTWSDGPLPWDIQNNSGGAMPCGLMKNGYSFQLKSPRPALRQRH